ncbi:Stage II sporulation protein E [Treponema primitia ZAS-2]|uniref:Stage II sporulation protein E n=1 Tax=Treponema primitia (strain ATCC BAA-887 / DSM 12427 / ZAS-2) TaxID=545694 RepID=F5YNR2_TREPZ|nr:SpoIIE family protein phosphatase [Treponema primitia]AEF85244.1 Stage II sporulation protein E [Treponema primitia ZAS-2]
MAETLEKPEISFTPLQIGYLVNCPAPIDIGETNEAALTIFRADPNLEAMPVIKEGKIIGVIPARDMLATFDGVSARMRAWQRELHLFVIPARATVAATTFISTLMDGFFEGEGGKNAAWFILEYKHQYLGIVSLRNMLKHTNSLRAQDLAQAREIQKNLLEKAVIDDKRIKLLFYNKMANEIGGDFYQVFQSWKGQYMVGCFDVAAQNISGSITAMALGACFETLVLSDFDGYAERMTEFINTLVRDVNPKGLHVGAVLFYIDFSTMTVKIHSCGFSRIHIFVSADNKQLSYKSLEPNMPPLGQHEELDVDKGQIVSIKKGLRIATHTNGLPNMTGFSGEKYGEKQAFNLLKTIHTLDQNSIPALMDKEINEWLGEAPLTDDITLMDMRFV